jgi:hypothetical protein
MDRGWLTFENSVPHVLDNPLPDHGAVNMIEAFERVSAFDEVEMSWVAPDLDVRNVATPLVPLHAKLCKASLFSHCYTLILDLKILAQDIFSSLIYVY